MQYRDPYAGGPPPQAQQGPIQPLQDPTRNLVPILAKGTLNLARRHYVVSSLWIAGLIILAFFQGAVVPQDRLNAYDKVMRGIDHKQHSKLLQEVWMTEEAFRASKGWFSCDAQCQLKKQSWKTAQARLAKLEQEQEKKRREANSVLGIFSTYGVDETKSLFWKSFHWGKKFGQRQTLFDMLFMGFRAMGRDESLLEYFFSILVHFLINMSLGMVTALVGFAFSLWSLIRSFSPDFLTALLFFAGAIVSASALVATYLTLLYGTAIGTVVVGVKVAVAAANRRIEAGEGGQPRRNLHYE